MPESCRLAMPGMARSNPKAKVSLHSPFLCSCRLFLEMSEDHGACRVTDMLPPNSDKVASGPHHDEMMVPHSRRWAWPGEGVAWEVGGAWVGGAVRTPFLWAQSQPHRVTLCLHTGYRLQR